MLFALSMLHISHWNMCTCFCTCSNVICQISPLDLPPLRLVHHVALPFHLASELTTISTMSFSMVLRSVTEWLWPFTGAPFSLGVTYVEWGQCTASILPLWSSLCGAPLGLHVKSTGKIGQDHSLLLDGMLN